MAQSPSTNSYASPSLYVGELNPDVSEAMLFDIFKQVGPVASIRVCRDAITRRSLGYAYVNFHNVSDAERALDTLNYAKIGDRPCRIMWSHRDPSKRKSGVGNVFIKNLDASIDHQNLNDTFSTFGNILSCKVELDEHGKSKGYGYVHYETEEEARRAIERVNGMQLADKVVSVTMFKPKKQREAELHNNFTNVFVKNLPSDVNQSKFNEVFGRYGKIQSAVIMTDKGNGSSRGFGFVNYEKPAEAREAVAKLHGTSQDFGQELYVARAQKKSERQTELRRQWEERKMENLSKYQGLNLYVKNLDDAVDDDLLRKEFAHCGTITSAKVMVDEKGGSRGFGFVCFSTQDEATKAVTEMNGALVLQKPIYVAMAQRKDVRRAQLEQQHQQRMRMNAGAGVGMYPPAPVFFPTGRGGVPPMYAVNAGGAGRQPWQGGRGGQGARPSYTQQVNFVSNNVRRGAGAAGVSRGRGGPGPKGPARGPAPTSRPAQSSRGRAAPSAATPGAIQPLPSAQELASQTPNETKIFLGDQLYHTIAKAQPSLAGKITGMLLESMDNTELLLLLEDATALEAKVSEALAVLRESGLVEEPAPATSGVVA